MAYLPPPTPFDERKRQLARRLSSGASRGRGYGGQRVGRIPGFAGRFKLGLGLGNVRQQFGGGGFVNPFADIAPSFIPLLQGGNPGDGDGFGPGPVPMPNDFTPPGATPKNIGPNVGSPMVYPSGPDLAALIFALQGYGRPSQSYGGGIGGGRYYGQ